MFKAIDQLVIVVSELDAAIHDHTAAGFTVIRGGCHDVGTHNALVAFADGSYLELIAFLEPVEGSSSSTAPAAVARWQRAEKGGGFVDFCMQTDDLAADAGAMRDACVTMDSPFLMRIVRVQLAKALHIPQRSRQRPRSYQPLSQHQDQSGPQRRTGGKQALSG